MTYKDGKQLMRLLAYLIEVRSISGQYFSISSTSQLQPAFEKKSKLYFWVEMPSKDRISFLCSVLAADGILSPVLVFGGKNQGNINGYTINESDARIALAGGKYNISLFTQPTWLWTLELSLFVAATFFAGLQWWDANQELREKNEQVHELEAQSEIQKQSLEQVKKENQILRDSLTHRPFASKIPLDTLKK